MTPADLRERRVGSVVVVTPVGTLDSTTSPGVRERLQTLLSRGDSVLVDLSRVSCVTSAGLRAVLLLHRQAQSTGTTIALTGMAEPVRAVMASTGFLNWIAVVGSVPEGIRELAARTVRS